MINIKQINIAVKVAGEEYIKNNDTKTVSNIHSILYVNSMMCQEILHLSEQYLTNSISNPQVLEESLTWLRAHIKLDEHFVQQVSVKEYLKVSNQIN